MKASSIFIAILKGILAGLAIAFGGFLFILSTTYIKLNMNIILVTYYLVMGM